MKKNKKGFTLIELLAVIIILIIIMLLAITYIRTYTKKSKNDSLIANALNYVKAVDVLLEGDHDEQISVGTFSVSELASHGLTLSGTKPDSGYVMIFNGEILSACLIYSSQTLKYDGENMSNPKKGSLCGEPIDVVITKDFDYTGTEEVYLAPVSGYYKLEVWGASGGNSGPSDDRKGGYGGYSVGVAYLTGNTLLYVNVGGAGVGTSSAANQVAPGGYNGGGSASNGGRDYRYAGSGGGATSIATKSGLLSTLSSDTDKILIVAGGGGGSWIYPDNTRFSSNVVGHAGGFKGVTGTTTDGATCAGGTQSTGYAFGQAFNGTSGETAGGGGGYYAGYGATICAGGGSGFINPNLTDASMYCYNCDASNDDATKTVSTLCTNLDPVEKCAKQSAGYARITFISETVEDEDD